VFTLRIPTTTNRIPKSRINQTKHKLGLYDSRVFDDPKVVLLRDALSTAKSGGTGAVSALLLVVHIYREDDVNGEEIIRIISAREVSRVAPVYIRKRSISGSSSRSNSQTQAAGDDSGIDYSDIPALTDAQLRRFRRAPRFWWQLDWIATSTTGSETTEKGIRLASTVFCVR
jgi:uncharacterized DUF497 family protein